MVFEHVYAHGSIRANQFKLLQQKAADTQTLHCKGSNLNETKQNNHIKSFNKMHQFW